MKKNTLVYILVLIIILPPISSCNQKDPTKQDEKGPTRNRRRRKRSERSQDRNSP